MDGPNLQPKDCTTQHLRTGCPTNEWTPEELMIYAQSQSAALRDDEQKLAVKYWRLGVALNLLRQNFNHGQWEMLLHQLRLEKTKAARARAIAKTFAEEQQVAGLTVKEAYERRERKPRHTGSTPAKSKNELAGLRRFLNHVVKKADYYLDDAAFAEGISAAETLLAVDAALDKLQTLRKYMQQQATEAQGAQSE